MTGKKYHLAQLNIAIMKYPIDDPGMADFVARLDEINALAEASPGFVWRLKDESGNATNLNPFDNPMYLINMSVWESIEQLKHYTYKSAHVEVMRLRKQWFHLMKEAHYVLWWIQAGQTPTLEEAKLRLEKLQKEGPSREAFDFKNEWMSG